VTASDGTAEEASRGLPSSVVALSLIVVISSIVAVGIIAATTFFMTTHVATARDARHLEYGFPFTWVTQDQSEFLQKPSLPSDQSMASPLENPTDADPADLAYDFLILGFGPPALLAAGAGLIRLARRPRGRTTPLVVEP
jgi:hypothetical protein